MSAGVTEWCCSCYLNDIVQAKRCNLANINSKMAVICIRSVQVRIVRVDLLYQTLNCFNLVLIIIIRWLLWFVLLKWPIEGMLCIKWDSVNICIGFVVLLIICSLCATRCRSLSLMTCVHVLVSICSGQNRKLRFG